MQPHIKTEEGGARMPENRKRAITIKLRVTEQEHALIEQRMAQLGVSNREAYLRKNGDGRVCHQLGFIRCKGACFAPAAEEETTVAHQYGFCAPYLTTFLFRWS